MTVLTGQLDELRSCGLLRFLRRAEPQGGVRLRLDGREVINFCSNDYLGLADDLRLKAAMHTATERWGAGAGAARLITGNLPPHEELEAALAAFKGAEAALLFNSGYQANIGAIPALAGEGDAIFSDELNHASLIDGCRLARARTVVFRHNDVNHLETLLRSHSPSPLGGEGRGEGGARSGRRLIVTEAVFSMDGDRAPLRELMALAERYDAWIYLDEAHATGVVDDIAAHERLIRMGTLGKALGCFGAYLAGPRELREYLINRARSFIFATALPPGVAAAAREAVRIVQAEPERRARLWENIRLTAARLNACPELRRRSAAPNSAIFPISIGNPQRAIAASEALLEKGFFVQAIRPPTVPEGTSRLRLTVSAAHTPEMIEGLIAALREGRA